MCVIIQKETLTRRSAERNSQISRDLSVTYCRGSRGLVLGAVDPHNTQNAKQEGAERGGYTTWQIRPMSKENVIPDGEEREYSKKTGRGV